MKALLLCLLFLVGCSPKWRLTWQEEFSGKELDTKKWQYYDNYKERHGAVHNPEMAEVSNGTLKIKVSTKDKVNFTSIIKTKELFSTGYFELRARVSPESGQWVDWWMLDDDILNGVNSQPECQEIDCFEIRKFDEKQNNISDGLYYNIHRFGYGEEHRWDGKFVRNLNLIDGKFHIFGFFRSKKQYIFYVDGKETWRTDKITPRKLNFLLSCELLDNFWAGKVPPEGYDNIALEVDYLRIFESN